VFLAGAERPEHVDDNFRGPSTCLPSEALKALNAASDQYIPSQGECKETPPAK
jgi:hypothetical protein